MGCARTLLAIDSIGVIPEPAAMHRCRPPTAGSARKLPVGVCTSISVPGVTSRTSHEENIPSGISRTPIRGRSPTAEQIEYDRRSSRPSTHVRRVSDWPAAKA